MARQNIIVVDILGNFSYCSRALASRRLCSMHRSSDILTRPAAACPAERNQHLNLRNDRNPPASPMASGSASEHHKELGRECRECRKIDYRAEGPRMSLLSRSRLERVGHGAWKIATTKRPARTMVIDTDEHLSHFWLAAALSGVHSMHRSSAYQGARRGPRQPSGWLGRMGEPGPRAAGSVVASALKTGSGNGGNVTILRDGVASRDQQEVEREPREPAAGSSGTAGGLSLRCSPRRVEGHALSLPTLFSRSNRL